MRSIAPGCLLAFSFVFIVSGCAQKMPELSSQASIDAFSHPPAATPQERASNLQEQVDNFKRLHPERFVNGKIIGPSGSASSGPASTP